MSITVYTDGSCINNGKKNRNIVAGIGVYFGDDDPRNISAPFTTPPITNNRAELAAILAALKAILCDKDLVDVTICSDSDYSMKSVTIWLDKHKRNGWKTSKGTIVLNKDLITQIDKILNTHTIRGHKVTFQYVKGHVDKNNIKADTLAKKGTQKSKYTQ